MPQQIKFPAQKTWWIAHNNDSICHYGLIQTTQQVTTGQPVLEDYTDVSTFIQRLIDLGKQINTQSELDNLLDGETISQSLTDQILVPQEE